MSLSRRDTASGRYKEAGFATEESSTLEMLRYAQHDISNLCENFFDTLHRSLDGYSHI